MKLLSFQSFNNIWIHGVQHYLPNNIYNNQRLVDWMQLKIRPSWIEKRTGICSRHFVNEGETCSTLGMATAQKTLDELKIFDPGQLILATVSADYLTPPTAPLIQHGLKLEGCGAFDLGAACTGFVSTLHLGGCLTSGNGKPSLLISSELRSRFLNPKDFASSVLFGDGSASAMIVSSPENNSFKLHASALLSDGSIGDLISIPGGGSRLPGHLVSDKDDFFIKMKSGAEIFARAVGGMHQLAKKFLYLLNEECEDIWLVPHQANGHLIKALGDKLSIPESKVVKTIQHTGNTSGASVGIALSHLRASSDLRDGDKILLLAAGGGGLLACALLSFVA